MIARETTRWTHLTGENLIKKLFDLCTQSVR